LDKKRAEILSYFYDNRNTNYGLRTTVNEWAFDEQTNNLIETFTTRLYTVGSQLTDLFDIKVNKVSSSYIKNGEEIDLILFDGKNPFFNINTDFGITTLT
jgi:hypothetical protein